MDRRLPVYMLIDVSGSMAGENIECVRNGLSALVEGLRENPIALDNAYLSVITFGNEAKQVVPLTDLDDFQEPQLEAHGCTAMGDALKLVCECAKKELISTTAETKGDWRPLVFLFTDGEPTDDITDGLNEFKKIRWGQKVCCATPDGDMHTLEKISEIVLKMKDTTPQTFDKYFKWVTASIVSTTKSIATTGNDEVAAAGGVGPAIPEDLLNIE